MTVKVVRLAPWCHDGRHVTTPGGVLIGEESLAVDWAKLPAADLIAYETNPFLMIEGVSYEARRGEPERPPVHTGGMATKTIPLGFGTGFSPVLKTRRP